LAGTGLADHLAGDGQYFAIFTDGHHRQLPRITGGPFRYKTFASEFVKKSKAMTSKPIKQAVIAPSMLALLYPLDEEVEGYSREQFLSDICDECEKDIRQCFAEGAARVSIDFTEGRLACRNDPNNPWTGRGMLEGFIELNNRVVDRFSAEERKNIGVHTCPGGDCDATHSADVDYAELLPSMFKMNAGYFLIQLASEPDKEHVYKLIGEHSRADANGVAQVAFIGVINPQNPRVETPQEVCDDLMLASKHIPKERLGATDDCGFSPFSIDVKPKHGSPDAARDIAFQKIAARMEGVKMASEKLGL
jgi:methionine synthase II (cobalamin-independent)